MPKINTSIPTNQKKILMIGFVSISLTIIAVLLEITITFFPGGSSQPATSQGWIALLHNNPFLGLRNLGLINIIIFSFGIPFYYSLYFLHQNDIVIGLSVIINFIATAVFFSTNKAFPMLEISKQYYNAVSTYQKETVEATAFALLSIGKSHSPGTFFVFFFGNISGILISINMLRSKIFKKYISIFGIFGFSLLLLFEVIVLIVSEINAIAIVISTIGGILNLIWLLLIGLKFYSLLKE